MKANMNHKSEQERQSLGHVARDARTVCYGLYTHSNARTAITVLSCYNTNTSERG